MELHTSLILEIFSVELGFFLYREGGWFTVLENNLGSV
jgi:hypothetical protein